MRLLGEEPNNSGNKLCNLGGGMGRRIDKVQEGLSPLIKNPHVRFESLPEIDPLRRENETLPLWSACQSVE